jgi:hypothetical protein
MSNPGGASISTEQLKARYVGTGVWILGASRSSDYLAAAFCDDSTFCFLLYFADSVHVLLSEQAMRIWANSKWLFVRLDASILLYKSANSRLIGLHLLRYCDLLKSEWITNQHRDTYASHVSHYDQLSYYAVAQNVSIARARHQFIHKMIQPCGPYEFVVSVSGIDAF